MDIQKRRQYVGTFGTSTPPEKIGKFVVEIWCYLPEVCTLGEESEIQEIFSKNVKKSIFHRDFDQKISTFSWNFSEFSSLLVQTRKVLQAGCLLLPVQWKSFLKSWWSCIFLQIPADFLNKIQEFSCHFNSPSLSKLLF